MLQSAEMGVKRAGPRCRRTPRVPRRAGSGRPLRRECPGRPEAVASARAGDEPRSAARCRSAPSGSPAICRGVSRASSPNRPSSSATRAVANSSAAKPGPTTLVRSVPQPSSAASGSTPTEKATCAITSVVHVAPSRRLVRPESAPAPEPREATRGLERGHEAGHGGPGHGHRAAGSGPRTSPLQRESSPGASRTPSRFALGWAGHRFARLGGPSSRMRSGRFAASPCLALPASDYRRNSK